jgi:hypothetical protein
MNLTKSGIEIQAPLPEKNASDVHWRKRKAPSTDDADFTDQKIKSGFYLCHLRNLRIIF